MNRTMAFCALAALAALAITQNVRGELITLDFSVPEPVNMTLYWSEPQPVNMGSYTEDGFRIQNVGNRNRALSEIGPDFGGSWSFSAEESYGMGFLITHESSTFDLRSFDAILLSDNSMVGFRGVSGLWNQAFFSVQGRANTWGGSGPGDELGTYTLDGPQWAGLSSLYIEFDDFGEGGASAVIDNIVLRVPCPSVIGFASPVLGVAFLRRRRRNT